MKIKKILGLILFTFACVLALASCGSGTFQTEYFGRTYSGDLYVNGGSYYLISGDMVYSVKLITDNNGEKTIYISELHNYVERIDDYTLMQRYNGYSTNYYLLINGGQELLVLSGDYTYIYFKTDHIE